ncbi:hypothetical protein SFRURICE_011164 [Spodoptera frugiperda]|nr:hypothetical protein SFRURICE_011164 [Spodoptera frugiperda]
MAFEQFVYEVNEKGENVLVKSINSDTASSVYCLPLRCENPERRERQVTSGWSLHLVRREAPSSGRI